MSHYLLNLIWEIKTHIQRHCIYKYGIVVFVEVGCGTSELRRARQSNSRWRQTRESRMKNISRFYGKWWLCPIISSVLTVTKEDQHMWIWRMELSFAHRAAACCEYDDQPVVCVTATTHKVDNIDNIDSTDFLLSLTAALSCVKVNVCVVRIYFNVSSQICVSYDSNWMRVQIELYTSIKSII